MATTTRVRMELMAGGNGRGLRDKAYLKCERMMV
jgi:hypothetical protein